MKLRRRNKFAAEVNTASLNDIMFFLMLFFLIVSTIAAPGLLKVSLPKSDAAPTGNKPTLDLSISHDYRYSIGNTEVPAERLPEELAKTLSGQTDQVIKLNIDKSVPVEYLVKIYDLVIKYNASTKSNVRVVLATEPPK
jgi:biopolymer transport protein ExbD